MDRSERFHKIEMLLAQRRTTSFMHLQQELEVSRATLRRDLQFMRTRLHTPIEWSPDDGGYRLSEPAQGEEPYHRTSLWFSSSEIHSLLMLDHLVRQIDPAGVLGTQVAPLERRLEALLDGAGDEAAQLRHRVRIVGMARRAVQPRHFQHVGTALVRRRRLRIDYLARSSGRESQREVSPLRLVHYRDNWYLDAWCHLREALRNFSVDAIRAVTLLDAPAKEVSDATLDAAFKASYGIFSGTEIRWARLRFGAERARWVANEEWHPQQRGRWDEQGRWLLDVPYADPRELVKDILQHVPDVEVLGPPGLRQEVRQRLQQGLQRLGETG